MHGMHPSVQEIKLLLGEGANIVLDLRYPFVDHYKFEELLEMVKCFPQAEHLMGHLTIRLDGLKNSPLDAHYDFKQLLQLTQAARPDAKPARVTFVFEQATRSHSM